MQPCILYLNSKPPLQYLFIASSALYALTGDAYYRFDADYFWPEESPDLLTFLYNWNNVVAQGVIILSSQPDFPGAARPRDFYRTLLRSAVAHWARCSNSGSSEYFDFTFCKFAPVLRSLFVLCGLCVRAMNAVNAVHAACATPTGCML